MLIFKQQLGQLNKQAKSFSENALACFVYLRNENKNLIKKQGAEKQRIIELLKQTYFFLVSIVVIGLLLWFNNSEIGMYLVFSYLLLDIFLKIISPPTQLSDLRRFIYLSLDIGKTTHLLLFTFFVFPFNVFLFFSAVILIFINLENALVLLSMGGIVLMNSYFFTSIRLLNKTFKMKLGISIVVFLIIYGLFYFYLKNHSAGIVFLAPIGIGILGFHLFLKQILRQNLYH